jgi:hypothetical protein
LLFLGDRVINPRHNRLADGIAAIARLYRFRAILRKSRWQVFDLDRTGMMPNNIKNNLSIMLLLNEILLFAFDLCDYFDVYLDSSRDLESLLSRQSQMADAQMTVI